MGFARLLISWAIAMLVYAAAFQFWYFARGKVTSGFVEGLLGLSVLLAIPTFLFALFVGWPVMSLLAGLRPAWILPPVAGAALAVLMGLLAGLILPASVRGVGHSLAIYAGVLGLVWGCILLILLPR
jgi:hypothetical protein